MILRLELHAALMAKQDEAVTILALKAGFEGMAITEWAAIMLDLLSEMPENVRHYWLEDDCPCQAHLIDEWPENG